MKEIKSKEGYFLSQTGANGERIYVTAITGANVNEADWRDASQEEQEAYTDLEGCNNYDEVLAVKEQVADETKKLTRKINYIGLTDNEALSVKQLYPRWEDKVNTTIEAGYITLYNDNLWRARQTHTAMEIYPPSLDTASLYEVIVKDHEGTMEDPIPYTPPMEIFEGKYYTQYDVLYKCTRDSGTALSHDLYDLKGLYVEIIER
jgi:hypothetical protein